MAVGTDVTAIDQLTAPGEPFELVRTGPNGSGTLVYRNAPRSLREVLIGAGRHATSDTYLVYEGRRLTEAEHDRFTRRLATFLYEDAQVRPGDRVSIAMRNLPEFSIAFWAVQALGAVAVPLNAWSSGAELAGFIRHSGSRMLIADTARWQRLQPERGTLDLQTVLVTDADAPTRGDPAPDGATSLEAVLADPAPEDYPAVDVGPDDPASIVYTSGTTGSPKGAVHTQRNYCSGIMHNLLHGEIARRELATRPAVAARADSVQACILLTYPLFHIAGLINLCLSLGSARRTKLVLMHHWDPDRATVAIIDEQVTRALLVPTTLRTLLAAGGERLAATPGIALHFVAAGGASVPAELINRITELFDGRVLPGNGYGLTETTAGAIAGTGAEYINNPASIGRPLPAMEIRIVDLDSDSEAAVGSVGEIVVRGPSVCAGYWNNPDETAKAFSDGWFRTGDLGRVDDTGLYYVVDRIKEVIIRGGENIFCPEVESVLESHPDVLEAGVFSLPDIEFGEIVGAVVGLRPTSSVDEEQLRAYVADRLAYFKVPARIVLTSDALPRTASGKLLKRDLRPLAVAPTTGGDGHARPRSGMPEQEKRS